MILPIPRIFHESFDKNLTTTHLSLYSLYRKWLATPAKEKTMWTSTNVLEGLSRLQGILKFCQVANFNNTSFHLTALKERLLKNAFVSLGQETILDNPKRLRRIIVDTYRQALDKHMKGNSAGPAPKSIRLLCSQNWIYTLRWSTISGVDIYLTVTNKPRCTLMRLNERRGASFSLLLTVTGYDKKSVSNFTSRGELNPPVKIFETPEYAAAPVPDRSFRDIKVPLGDLLDFLKRYQ